MRRTPIGRQKFTGRGALSNPPGRFDLQQLASVDDGWYVEESPDSIATTLEPEKAREVITTNDSPDIPFEQSINPATQELKSNKAVLTYADILAISSLDCDTTMVTSVH